MRKDWITLLSPMVAAPMPAIVPAQDAEHYVSPWKTPWTYEQARDWGQLDSSYALCNIGQEQSPIDIRDAQKAALPALRFEYKSGQLKYVINNGHTIRVNYYDAQGTGNVLIEGDKQYQLTQFHFHRPSEEYVAGNPFAMEVHLMHQASDGTVAGVTVFLKAGSANSTVQKIWKPMPAPLSTLLAYNRSMLSPIRKLLSTQWKNEALSNRQHRTISIGKRRSDQHSFWIDSQLGHYRQCVIRG